MNSKVEIFIANLVGPALRAQFSPYCEWVDYIGPEKLTKMGVLKSVSTMARFAHGSDFNPGGWCHDELYKIGGDPSFKAWADDVFLKIMRFIISLQRGFSRILHRIAAEIRAYEYYKLVHKFGNTCFNFSGSGSIPEGAKS